MPKVELDLETPIEPERVRAALLDFSERRPDIWPGIEPSLYEVYAVGPAWADIQEGSRMPGMQIWAKEHYDWSTPGVITWTVKESNFCAPGSFVSAEIGARDGGGSRIHIVWNRRPTTLGARLMALLIVAGKGAPVAASLRMAMRRLEAETARQPAA
jgi:hypothetical protein